MPRGERKIHNQTLFRSVNKQSVKALLRILLWVAVLSSAMALRCR